MFDPSEAPADISRDDSFVGPPLGVQDPLVLVLLVQLRLLWQGGGNPIG